MSHPCVSLGLWSGAWLVGQASADDLLTALRHVGAENLVVSEDTGVAELLGLAPGEPGGTADLMRLLRRTLAPPTGDVPTDHGGPRVRVVLPEPGDVRGLPAGTEIADEAMRTGGALLILASDGNVLGLTCDDTDAGEPDADDPTAGAAGAGTALWRVYALDAEPRRPEHLATGEAEYLMRESVREASALIARTAGDAGWSGDPRAEIADLLADASEWPWPEGIPPRVAGVLGTADHVEAIIAVAASHRPDLVGMLHPLRARIRVARESAVETALAGWLRPDVG